MWVEQTQLEKINHSQSPCVENDRQIVKFIGIKL